jgi:hypothetical protein
MHRCRQAMTSVTCHLFNRFATLAGMESNSRDFSAINSLAKAQRLFEVDELEPLYLLPPEFGGQRTPQNIVYVPPGIAAIKEQIDSAIADMVKQGVVTSYAAEPEYKGNSFIPSKIKIKTSQPNKPGGIDRTIDIW